MNDIEIMHFMMCWKLPSGTGPWPCHGTNKYADGCWFDIYLEKIKRKEEFWGGISCSVPLRFLRFLSPFWWLPCIWHSHHHNAGNSILESEFSKQLLLWTLGPPTVGLLGCQNLKQIMKWKIFIDLCNPHYQTTTGLLIHTGLGCSRAAVLLKRRTGTQSASGMIQKGNGTAISIATAMVPNRCSPSLKSFRHGRLICHCASRKCVAEWPWWNLTPALAPNEFHPWPGPPG